MEYLNKDNLAGADAFIHGALWLDIRRCLMAREPELADTKDSPTEAAAKAYVRKGYEQVLQLIEALPYDRPPDEQGPFSRPAITDTRD